MKIDLFQFNESLIHLAHWYNQNKANLPWRDQPDIYRVWISEIMLQQTQIKTVIPYFNKFINRFPDVETLAAASLDEIYLYWAGLGYYSRAKNLYQTAQIIAEKKEFPENRKEWLALPGIGQYTAGAILSIALNKAEPILDGNVKRVLSRVRLVQKNKNFEKYLWIISKLFLRFALKNQIKASDFNQALMDLGREICLSKIPNCTCCAFNPICKARHLNLISEFPGRDKKKWKNKTETTYCCIIQDKILLVKQKKGRWRAGLWDLPDFMPLSLLTHKEKLTFSGSVTTRHVVTDHKIIRLTQIYLGSQETGHDSKEWVLMDSLDSFSDQDFYWLSLDLIDYPPVAIGAALKKSLIAIKAALV